jgi:A/G-specific adenine glycosylase
MLQQTQVATVIPYYERFLARFPHIASLAAAPADEVMALWSGLGYYARARNLQRTAQEVVTQWGGLFPRRAADIETLPGIGRSTAAAIAVFAFGARAAILDGNVKRVLTRAFGIEGYPGEKAVEARLWALAESLLPDRDLVAYTQGLMDLGATLCARTKPACDTCPLDPLCVARREDRVTALPTPRPKRTQPQRSATLLVLRRNESILLERRPPAGIWGGLHSLPELPEPEHDPHAFAARVCCCEIGTVQALPPVRHAFTHFRLDISPLLCEVVREQMAAREDRYLWLSREELAAAPLPAPIRKILGGLLRPAPRRGKAGPS